MPRRRLQEQTGAAPMGSERIPYDQTDPMQQMPAGAGAPALGGSPPASVVPPGAPDLGALGGGQPDLLGGGGPVGQPPDGGVMGGDGGQGLGAALQGAGPGSSDNLTGNDLAALSAPVDGLMSPEEQQVAQMEQALNDPNTPPDQVQQIQQMLDLAARRRLAGLGGGNPQGGGM